MKSPYHGGDRPQEKIKHYCCPAAGAPETAVMYQHLSSFQPLDLKYDTFCAVCYILDVYDISCAVCVYCAVLCVINVVNFYL